MEAYVECPACQERLEFALSCEVLLADAIDPKPKRKKMEYEGIEWELRAPTSRDLAVVMLARQLSSEAQVSEATDALLACCVTPSPETSSASVSARELLRARLVAELAELDPQAEIRIELTCQACGHVWPSLFDITGFLWNEIRARSRRLLQEADVLARRYGWSEADILQMGERRRELYVQMALS